MSYSRRVSELTAVIAQRVHGKDPAQYMLTLEQMIENDYPIPSYMADVFEKPDGWVETPQRPNESLLTSPHEKTPQRQIYAIDCEMVILSTEPTFSVAYSKTVYDRGRQGAHPSLHC